MTPPIALHTLTLTLLAAPLLSGCLNLKPAEDPTRYFVLAPQPAGATPSAAAPPGPAIGLSPIALPRYLDPERLAIRKSDQEVHYLDYSRWAEPLDRGLQRVLAQNLLQLLPTDRLYLSAWTRSSVACEVSVTVARFDVTANGHVTLDATWRITIPGGGSVLRSGHSRLEKEGPDPVSQPDAAVATLSETWNAFSQELANVLNGLKLPTNPASH